MNVEGRLLSKGCEPLATSYETFDSMSFFTTANAQFNTQLRCVAIPLSTK